MVYVCRTRKQLLPVQAESRNAAREGGSDRSFAHRHPRERLLAADRLHSLELSLHAERRQKHETIKQKKVSPWTPSTPPPPEKQQQRRPRYDRQRPRAEE